MSTGTPLKIAIVAGEPSGDTLGARLVESLSKRHPNAQFFGIGGPKMISAGFHSWYPMSILSVNGLVEVLKHFPTIYKTRSGLIKRLLHEKPDVFIGIDSPDFNLGVEAKLKKQGIPIVHYISPTIWAWRPNRIYTIQKACDLVLVLYPFEAPLYHAKQIRAEYVGHPLADDIPLTPPTLEKRKLLNLSFEEPIITMLPGSRMSELRFHADLMIQTAKLIAKKYPSAQFVVPFVSKPTRELFEESITRNEAHNLRFKLLYGQSHDALAASDVVIASSGTATLEAALWKKPMVITYKLSWLTWQIGKRVVHLKWVGLPNILCNESIVPEFLQDEATPKKLAEATLDWIHNPDKVEKLVDRYYALHKELHLGVSDAAANAIDKLIEENLEKKIVLDNQAV